MTNPGFLGATNTAQLLRFISHFPVLTLMQSQETVKMLPHQPQPQLDQVVTMLDNAKDLLDQHKRVEKTFPKLNMQTEIR